MMRDRIQGNYSRNTNRVAIIAILVLIVAVAGYSVTAATTSSSATKTITDMTGRTVEIPVTFNRVVSLIPSTTFLAYRYAPEKLVSVDTVSATLIKSKVNPYPESDVKNLLSLPQNCVYFNECNAEQILSTNPDLILTADNDMNADKEQAQWGVPVVRIVGTTVADYSDAFKWSGKLFDNEAVGNEMAEIWNGTFDKVTAETDKIPQENKVKVYYASHDGILSTVGTDSKMASIIRMAGGRSFMDEVPPMPNNLSAEHQIASIEEIQKWDPDVIVTKTLDEKNKILADPQWQNLKAVKNGKVYSCLKYERMDGYQSALSVEWLANTLYPDKFHFDLTNDVKSFYKKFFGYDISDEEIAMPFTG